MATVLVQIETHSHRECRAFSTSLGSAVIQLVVTASSSVDAEALQLFNQLCATLKHSGARAESTLCRGTLKPGAQGCWATRHPGPVRRTIVWVSDHSGSLPPVALNATPWWNEIFPLLPIGTATTVLRGKVRAQVAEFYQSGKIGNHVPQILTTAGVLDDLFRVFISYRWDDAKAVADQLFDALARQHFDVYLDRFSTNPGTNFQERIRAELADKSCVVLLDSERVSGSSWVAGEYAFARQYRLGLMAIDLPGGRRSFPRIACRIDASSFFSGAFDAKTTLPLVDMDGIVSQIQQHYFAQISRRLRYQRQVLEAAAQLAGLPLSQRPDGVFQVSGSGRDYYLIASARPPGIQEFRIAAQVASAQPVNPPAQPGKPVVIGPLSAQMHQARQNIDWLARGTQSAAVDERALFSAMQSARQGNL